MLILGIDTGGTYTDGVVMERESKRVLKKAKALTTPHNLLLGIQECLDDLRLDTAKTPIDMVCLSTTLATNAIVEGRGCNAGLILIGRIPDGNLPVEHFEFVRGRFSIKGGMVEPLEEEDVVAALERVRGRYDALAVSGYASVRNPAHEKAVGALAWERLRIPVLYGHEMTMTLGYYERTVTTVLNARLIPIIRRLISAVCQVLESKKISAPIMVVKGDGSLMRASYALERPVDTILSGPAASIIGGAFLSGCDNAMIVDIGGTTTDIAHVREGRAKVNDEGATVAGWRTRVRAADLCTFGLGGDSSIRVEDNGGIQVGPQKVTPFCRSGEKHDRRGFTPTDVAHVLGEYREWDSERAANGAKICTLEFDPTLDAKAFSVMAHDAVIEKLRHCIDEGLALEKSSPAAIVGIGAPARTWMGKIEKGMQMPVSIPEHADVANAVGAAAGGVFEQSEVLVRWDRVEEQFFVHSTEGRSGYPTLEAAKVAAEKTASDLARENARKAGTEDPELIIHCKETVDDNGAFLECRIVADAFGYPSVICP